MYSIQLCLLVYLNVITVCREACERCATTNLTPPGPKTEPSKRGGKRSNAAAQSSLRVAGSSMEATPEKRRHRLRSLRLYSRSEVKAGHDTGAKQKTEVIVSSSYDECAYPIVYEDPKTVPSDNYPVDFEVHRRAFASFRHEGYEAFVEVNNEEKELSMAFITTFRPQSIESYPKRQKYKWCAFLLSPGVYADNGGETPRVEALKRRLLRKCHIQGRWKSLLERAVHQSHTPRENSLVILQPVQSRVLSDQVRRTVGVPLVDGQ